jgi:hypothetical protein
MANKCFITHAPGRSHSKFCILQSAFKRSATLGTTPQKTFPLPTGEGSKGEGNSLSRQAAWIFGRSVWLAAVDPEATKNIVECLPTTRRWRRHPLVYKALGWIPKHRIIHSPNLSAPGSLSTAERRE